MAAKGGKSLRKWGKNVGDFLKNVGDFLKNVGDFPKNVGDFSANVRVLRRDGGENSPQVGQRWENRWKGVPPLVQPSHPSGAIFPPLWCSLPPIWCSLHPKEGRINKPSALGLVGKICIFAATSYRCGAHRIVPSRVPRKALPTRRSLCPLPDHRWAATTSILILL